MANIHQNNVYRPVRRYTIPHLLQLAQQGPQAFDLSKFTYDAARAGVVPPLGDCAVTLRRTSGNRPRGWSTESVSTSEDIVVINDTSISLTHPERQPRGPPGEDKDQKDEGFARFLKKHSSPTHNRVTAGGRIVPMEKRESPPKFELPLPDGDTTPHMEPSKQVMPAAEAATGTAQAQSTEASQYHAPYAPAAYNVFGQGHGFPPTAPQNGVANVATGSYQQMAYPQYGPYYSNALPVYPSYSQTGHWQHGQPYNAQPYAPQYPSMVQPPTFGSRNIAPRPMRPNWPSNAELQDGPPYSMSQYCLKHADDLLTKLEQQIRSGDTKRANQAGPSDWGGHRMKIVEQRDETRSLINTLRAHIKVEKELACLQGVIRYPHQHLNVQAIPYVPQSAGSDRSTQAGLTETDKTPNGRRCKALAIVDPRGSSQTPTTGGPGRYSQSATKANVSKPSASSGDKQMIKSEYSTPSDELRAQMAEAARREIETADPNPFSEADSAEAFFYKSEIKQDADVSTGFYGNVTTSIMNNEGRERLARDAKELPKQGEALSQRLTSDNMSNKENALDTSSIRRRPLGVQKNLKREYNQTTLQELSQQKLHMQDKFARTDESMPNGFSAYNSQDVSSNVTTSTAENIPVDQMSNKGFSSTSMQLVNATIHVPSTYDGAGEGNRRDAKSMLEEAGKVKSPRLIQRSTPNGRA